MTNTESLSLEVNGVVLEHVRSCSHRARWSVWSCGRGRGTLLWSLLRSGRSCCLQTSHFTSYTLPYPSSTWGPLPFVDIAACGGVICEVVPSPAASRCRLNSSYSSPRIWAISPCMKAHGMADPTRGHFSPEGQYKSWPWKLDFHLELLNKSENLEKRMWKKKFLPFFMCYFINLSFFSN